MSWPSVPRCSTACRIPRGLSVDDARGLADLPVQQHERLLLGDHADRGVAHPRARQHDALDEVQRALHDLALDRTGLGGVGEQQRVAGLPDRLLGALDDLAVERVRDVGDHQRDGAGLPAERAGDRAGAVADPLGGGEDRAGRLGVDPPGAGVGPRDRGRSDAGLAGNVVDRRAIAHAADPRWAGRAGAIRQHLATSGRPAAPASMPEPRHHDDRVEGAPCCAPRTPPPANARRSTGSGVSASTPTAWGAPSGGSPGRSRTRRTWPCPRATTTCSPTRACVTTSARSGTSGRSGCPWWSGGGSSVVDRLHAPATVSGQRRLGPAAATRGSGDVTAVARAGELPAIRASVTVTFRPSRPASSSDVDGPRPAVLARLRTTTEGCIDLGLAGTPRCCRTGGTVVNPPRRHARLRRQRGAPARTGSTARRAARRQGRTPAGSVPGGQRARRPCPGWPTTRRAAGRHRLSTATIRASAAERTRSRCGAITGRRSGFGMHEADPVGRPTPRSWSDIPRWSGSDYKARRAGRTSVKVNRWCPVDRGRGSM